MKRKKETIAVVVVTYNRKDLLSECLTSLIHQTKKIDQIFVVDNNSNDGTKEFLREFSRKNKKINPLFLRKNIGAAGGFYEGMKKSYELGYDWIWMLDDDSIPHKTALKSLMNKLNILPSETGFLCSNVYGISGEVMNVPNINLEYSKNEYPFWNYFLEKGIVEISSCGWMSLFSRKVIKKIGYPIKELFLWGDDDDFTRRASKHFRGFLIGESKILHKRKIENTLNIIKEKDPKRIENFYFLYRNSLYSVKKNENKKILLKYLMGLIPVFFNIIKSPKRVLKLNIFIKGNFVGFFFNPPIEFPS
jgi:GT2 family glycosyltransferase